MNYPTLTKHKWAIELSSTNPLRPFDWRWQLSRKIIDDGLAQEFEEELDSITKDLISFLTTLQEAESPKDLLKLRSKLSDQYIAWEIYTNANNKRVREEMEALILSGTDFNFIASHFGITILAVKAYHDLFFDVKDRLNNKSLIVDLLMAPYEDVEIIPVYVYWKLVAIYGGASKLNEIISRKPSCAKYETIDLDTLTDNFIESFAVMQDRVNVVSLRTYKLKSDGITKLETIKQLQREEVAPETVEEEETITNRLQYAIEKIAWNTVEVNTDTVPNVLSLDVLINNNKELETSLEGRNAKTIRDKDR